MQQWRRVSYHIRIHTGVLGEERSRVDGIQLAQGHLGIHLREPEWADVTHIPSGLRLASFKSFGAALQFAEQCDTLHDWSSPLIEDMPADVRAKVIGLITFCTNTAHAPHPVRT